MAARLTLCSSCFTSHLPPLEEAEGACSLEGGAAGKGGVWQCRVYFGWGMLLTCGVQGRVRLVRMRPHHP